MKRTPRISNRSLALGFAALVLGGSAIAVLPPTLARSHLRRELETLEVELAKPVDGPEVVDRLTADLATLREFGKGRMTPIPAESDVAGLMGVLSGILTDLGLDRRDITTRAPKTFDGAHSMPVTVVLTGDFTSVYRAVARIEDLPRLVRVERLRVALDNHREHDPQRDGVVRADLSIDAFYEKPPDPSAQSDAAADHAAPHSTPPGVEGTRGGRTP